MKEKRLRKIFHFVERSRYCGIQLRNLSDGQDAELERRIKRLRDEIEHTWQRLDELSQEGES